MATARRDRPQPSTSARFRGTWRLPISTGKTDFLAWRASTGTWYWLTSSSGYRAEAAGARQWGNASLGDIPLVGDIDGDGKADRLAPA